MTNNLGKRMRNKNTSSLPLKLLAGCLAMAMAPAAFAASIAISPTSATGTPGDGTSPTVLQIQFSGDGTTAGFEVEVAFNATDLDVVAQPQNGANACSANNLTGVVTLQVVDGALNPLPAGPTNYCNLTFTVDGAVVAPNPGDPDIVYPLTLQNDLYSDGGGNPAPGPHSLTNGEIRIQGAPPDVTLSYNPAPPNGPAFSGGTFTGDTSTASIAVNAGGTSGSGTVTGCALSGTNAANFAITSGDLSIAAGGSDNITLECTHGLSERVATLQCTENDSDSTDAARSWNLTCPAGLPTPAPEYSSNPASGSTLSFQGAAGATVNRQLTITNTGFAGPGDTLSITSCSISGADAATFGVTPAIPPQVDLAVGENVALTVSATIPASGTNTATLTCESNDGTHNYPLTSAPRTAPVVDSPAIVPASSFWSKMILFGLLAGLGMLVVSLRRNG